MSLQTAVRELQAFGLVGEFYDDSPRRVAPYNVYAGSDQPVVGRAFTIDATTKTSANMGGTGVWGGILVSPKEYVLYGGLNATMEIPSGTPAQLATMGHVNVVVTTATSVGDYAFYNTTDGTIASAADTTPPANTAIIPNGRFVLVDAAAGEVAVLELGSDL